MAKLSGDEFERLVTRKLNEQGYQAEQVGRSGDFGADIKLTTASGTIVLFQCKRHQKKVNLKAVQEVLGAMGHYGADFGIVITNNGFLNSARKLAESHDVELWGGSELARFLTCNTAFSNLSEL